MQEYIVVKDILNIRSRPFLKDEYYIGEYYKDAIIPLYDDMVPGEQPPGTNSNLWMRNVGNGLIHSSGVRAVSWQEKKQRIIDAIIAFGNTAGADVAVLDTGINNGHPALAHITQHWDAMLNPIATFTPAVNNPHGLEMAGIITGRLAGSFVGVSPASSVTDIRILSPNNQGDFDHLLRALIHLEQSSPGVINLSVEMFKSIIPPNVLVGIEASMQRLIANRHIIVAASGNTCSSLKAWDLMYPGVSVQPITVGILQNGIPGFRAACIPFMNLSRQPDCFIELDDWSICSGGNISNSTVLASSEATAMLSGLIALKKVKIPILDQETVRQQIHRCSTIVPGPASLVIRKLDIPDFLNAL